MIDYAIPTDLASYATEDDLDAAIDGYLQALLIERQDFARSIVSAGSQADIDAALDAVTEVERRIYMTRWDTGRKNKDRADTLQRLLCPDVAAAAIEAGAHSRPGLIRRIIRKKP